MEMNRRSSHEWRNAWMNVHSVDRWMNSWTGIVWAVCTVSSKWLRMWHSLHCTVYTHLRHGFHFTVTHTISHTSRLQHLINYIAQQKKWNEIKKFGAAEGRGRERVRGGLWCKANASHTHQFISYVVVFSGCESWMRLKAISQFTIIMNACVLAKYSCTIDGSSSSSSISVCNQIELLWKWNYSIGTFLTFIVESPFQMFIFISPTITATHNHVRSLQIRNGSFRQCLCHI